MMRFWASGSSRASARNATWLAATMLAAMRCATVVVAQPSVTADLQLSAGAQNNALGYPFLPPTTRHDERSLEGEVASVGYSWTNGSPLFSLLTQGGVLSMFSHQSVSAEVGNLRASEGANCEAWGTLTDHIDVLGPVGAQATIMVRVVASWHFHFTRYNTGRLPDISAGLNHYTTMMGAGAAFSAAYAEGESSLSRPWKDARQGEVLYEGSVTVPSGARLNLQMFYGVTTTAGAGDDLHWRSMGLSGSQRIALKIVPEPGGTTPFSLRADSGHDYTLGFEDLSRATVRFTPKPEGYTGVARVPLTIALQVAGGGPDRTVLAPSCAPWTVNEVLLPGYGPSDLWIKGENWLAVRVRAIDLEGEQTIDLGDLATRVGDVNNDNAVNIADFIALRAAYGSSSADAAWNPNADLNGDGTVGIADFLLLRRNFGRSGDPR